MSTKFKYDYKIKLKDKDNQFVSGSIPADSEWDAIKQVIATHKDRPELDLNSLTITFDGDWQKFEDELKRWGAD